MKIQFNVNGYEIEASYREEEIENIFKPFLIQLNELYEQKHRRIVAFFAAPAGAGKTTLLCMLEKLALEMNLSFQGIGMDGFHHYQDYLESHFISRENHFIKMSEVKGCPETFDIVKLKKKIHELHTQDRVLWPYYDRPSHNPIEDQIVVSKNIVLIEGNYLLLDQPLWRDLIKECDYAVFMKCDRFFLKPRLVARKARNCDLKQAEAFVERSDMFNVDLVLKYPLLAQEVWSFDQEGIHLDEKNTIV